MHTTHELTSDTFDYRDAEGPVARHEVMPPISIADRLGIVVDDPTDGLGAGNFVLSCVTAFYDRFRERTAEFYEYPDYYTFQATSDPVDYQEFDIWPDHKNVSVPREPEAFLRAINDRGITILLVPESAPTSPSFEAVTRNSASRRIDSCYLYAPDGGLADADFSISLPHDTVAKWYEKTSESAWDGPDPPGSLVKDEATITQQFRRVGLSQALGRLPASDTR
ncbi:hypothetical protein [Haloferax sp. YSMS24]|uniref:hypothetical protein n=1 Tax=Haloferax sp. YSMS24 TaxID=3388425 RepID=UPI00398CE208